MINIFSSINKLLTFQNQSLIGVDDQMPLLNYIFIKAKPKRMYSNCQFMELYMGDKIKKNEGNYLIQLKSVIDFTYNLKPDNLLNITEKEFYDNCNAAAEIK